MTRPYAALEAEASEFYGAPCRVNERLDCMEVPAAAYEAKKAALADREDRMTAAPATVKIADLTEAFRKLREPLSGVTTAMNRLTDAFSLHVCGLRVVVAPHLLPGPTPDHTEDARRIVRHAMADVTLHGKPLVYPGPKPGERCHAVVRTDTNELWVSDELWERLQVEAPPPYAVVPEPLRSDVHEPVFRARNWAKFQQLPAHGVAGIRL